MMKRQQFSSVQSVFRKLNLSPICRFQHHPPSLIVFLSRSFPYSSEPPYYRDDSQHISLSSPRKSTSNVAIRRCEKGCLGITEVSLERGSLIWYSHLGQKLQHGCIKIVKKLRASSVFSSSSVVEFALFLLRLLFGVLDSVTFCWFWGWNRK